MTNEEFAAELDSVLSYNKTEIIENVLGLVKRKLEDTPPLTSDEIMKEIERSNLVHKTMLEWSNRFVANEVSNRLRCGIWDGRTVDKIFDTIWTEQFNISVKDRIRDKVYKAIDDIIKERIKSLEKA